MFHNLAQLDSYWCMSQRSQLWKPIMPPWPLSLLHFHNSNPKLTKPSNDFTFDRKAYLRKPFFKLLFLFTFHITQVLSVWDCLSAKQSDWVAIIICTRSCLFYICCCKIKVLWTIMFVLNYHSSMQQLCTMVRRLSNRNIWSGTNCSVYFESNRYE